MLTNDAKSDTNSHDIYVGNTDINGSYQSSNTKCLSNVGRIGIGVCIATGRYIILEHRGDKNVDITEFWAYNL